MKKNYWIIIIILAIIIITSIFVIINNKKNKAINNIEKDNSANLPQIVEEHGFIKNIWKKIKKIFSKD